MAKRKAKNHDRKKYQDISKEENVLHNQLFISSQDTVAKSTSSKNLIAEPVTIPWFKVSVISILISFLLLLALHTDLVSLFKFDNFINQQFGDYTEAYVDKSFSKDIMILTIEEDPQKNGGLEKFGPSWRKYHSQLINALSEAGAKVIAFDMYFENASPEDDENFGEAIQRANQTGTKVILGVRNYKSVDDKQVPQIIPKLVGYINSSNWALLDVGGRNRDSPLIRKRKGWAGRRSPQSPPTHSAP